MTLVCPWHSPDETGHHKEKWTDGTKLEVLHPRPQVSYKVPATREIKAKSLQWVESIILESTYGFIELSCQSVDEIRRVPV